MKPPAENPYVGLTHFTEEYADRFFGRDTECALIIGNLRAARLTLLYAESGVGKSSVLRAGVLARLHSFADRDLRARGSARLVPVVFSSWSERPVAALIHAIAEAARPYLPPRRALELPGDDLERAIESASAALEATLLIVLDQFEEYFLYPDDRDGEETAAAQIARCVSRPGLRANFLISIREDAYARLGDLFRGRINNVYGNFLHLDFLDRAGARESIEKPIERADELDPEADPFELEPALVTAVLDQVGRGRIAAAGDGSDGAGEGRDEVETTYLQLIMRRLWEEEVGSGSRRLRLRTFEDLGGAEAIVRGHLDRAMEGTADEEAGLSDDQRRVAAAVFHFLVTSGGTKIALTTKDLSDLSGLPEAEIDPVLQHLSSPSLHILRPVVSENGQDPPRFEIFHDALARPIVEWRTRVEEAELDARVAREREKKERAQRAATEAERRAAGEAKRKRLALALLGLAVLALLAVAGYFVKTQGERADRRDAAADSVSATERIAALEGAPTFGPAAAALASTEAYRLSPTIEARNLALGELQLYPGLPRLVAGHTRAVNAVAFWPGSRRFASGSSDGTVRLWKPGGEELRRPLVIPGETIRSIAVSAVSAVNGNRTRLIAAGLGSGAVELWEVEDRTALVLFHGELPAAGSGNVWGLAFDPRDPSRLAVGGSGRRVALWDLTNPAEPVPRGVRDAGGQIRDLAFDPSGRELMVAAGGGRRAWRVSRAGFAGSRPVIGEAREDESVALAPNGSYAFGDYGRIDLWDARRRRELRLRVPGDVLSLAFARGGSVLVAGNQDGNVTSWDVAGGRPFGPPRGDGGPVFEVAVSSDGKTIASTGEDGLVKLWTLAPKRALARIVGGLDPGEADHRLPRISSLAVSGSGEVAAAAGPAGTTIWKLRDSRPVPRPLARIPRSSHAVAYHGDILAVGRGHSFVLEDTGPTCSTMPGEPCRLAAPARAYSEKDVVSLALERQGDKLLLASSGYRKGKGLVNLWDVTDAARSGKVVHLSSRHRSSEISQVALSPGGRLAAAGGVDGKLRVWDLSDPVDPDGVEINHPRGNEDQPITAVAFSPRGNWLASGGRDQQVVLWRVAEGDSGQPTVEPTPGTLYQAQDILSLAFSPDGRTIAVGGGNGAACLYDVRDREEIGFGGCLLGDLVAHGGIKSVAFARDRGGGTSLLTAGAGQSIVAWNSVLWNLSDDESTKQTIAADVCALARRNLSAYEWSAIFDSTKLAGDRRQTCPRYPLP